MLTTKELNKLGDVLVAPITQGGDFARYAGFAVTLIGTGCKTQGPGEQDSDAGFSCSEGA